MIVAKGNSQLLQVAFALNPSSGFTRYWDDVAKVPYAYNPNLEGGVFASYDDAQSTRLKLDFAHSRHLGGVLFWEISADLPVSNSDSLIRIASEAMLTPEVQSVTVNDGTSAQRSMVRSLQVTFDTQVTFDKALMEYLLRRQRRF